MRTLRSKRGQSELVAPVSPIKKKKKGVLSNSSTGVNNHIATTADKKGKATKKNNPTSYDEEAADDGENANDADDGQKGISCCNETRSLFLSHLNPSKKGFFGLIIILKWALSRHLISFKSNY